MSFERSQGDRGPALAAAHEPGPAVPGKHTLTAQLGIAQVQRRADAGAPRDAGDVGDADVHAAAAHGTSGGAGPLPYRDQIQRLFGRHDISGVQAHVGGPAAEGAGAMGAEAFAVGDHVAFAGAPDLHTAAHEAAHVVQQRGGVQLKGGVGEAGDVHERHADAVADLVVQGKSSEALLDQYAGPHAGHEGGHDASPGSATAPGSGAVQRLAFVGGKQLKKSDPFAKGKMADFITDDVVRDYTSKLEFQLHTLGRTDYIGNLNDGTWVRFEPRGLNILGEMHILVSLREVIAAVGGTHSFIDERLAADDFKDKPQMKAAYETENAETFKEFGIDGEKDKQKFGAESLVPKIGYALSKVLPKLREGKLGGLTREEGYDGKVMQRYIKIGWAWAKDIRAQVAAQRKAKQVPPAKHAALAGVVTAVEGDIDAFLTALPVDGFFGDAFVDNDQGKHLPNIIKYIAAALDALVEEAVAAPSNRMTGEQKKKFAGTTTTEEQTAMFSDWRNFQFEDSVAAAAASGVRYAGMGAGHLYHLEKVGLPRFSHAFDMSGKHLDLFQKHTNELKSKAVKP